MKTTPSLSTCALYMSSTRNQSQRARKTQTCMHVAGAASSALPGNVGCIMSLLSARWSRLAQCVAHSALRRADSRSAFAEAVRGAR
jgi:hypothetical protein